MKRPTLSVVMPNYNHVSFLPRAIEALLHQTRPPDELLILDDASTDNSVEVIQRYARQHSCIRVVHNKQNIGVNRANDRLFQLARGDYIHPAAADDDRYGEFFQIAMDLAAKYPQAGLVFGKMVVKNPRDEQLGVVEARRWKEPLYSSPKQFLAEYLDAELATHAATAATIYRRDAFQEVGWYRPELGAWADSFAVRAIGLKHGVAYAPVEFAVHRKLPGSYSERSRLQPRAMLDVVARAARLMESDAFRDRFPAKHVRQWQRQFRWLTIWNYWLGSDLNLPGQRASFWRRNLRRLPRTLPALALAFYRGDATCYD